MFQKIQLLLGLILRIWYDIYLNLQLSRGRSHLLNQFYAMERISVEYCCGCHCIPSCRFLGLLQVCIHKTSYFFCLIILHTRANIDPYQCSFLLPSISSLRKRNKKKTVRQSYQHPRGLCHHHRKSSLLGYIYRHQFVAHPILMLTTRFVAATVLITNFNLDHSPDCLTIIQILAP